MAGDERYRLLLQRHLPDFRIDSFEQVGHGWDSAAYEVNGDWIFRFPPRPEVEAGLRKEAALLPKLVFPLLDPAERAAARAMFEDFFALSSNLGFEAVLIHADLGPGHILCRDDDVSGVIDWSDARVGDPALDFAWLLHGVDEGFAESLLGCYAGPRTAGDSLRERALFYHRLGPWHEVLYGLERGGPSYVQSGLNGVRRRLPRRKYDRSA